jgi:potassium-transporting ATPase KdpC subunit
MPIVRPAIVLLLLLTVITGVVYPALITATAQAVFPEQANGSLLREGQLVRGSRLIGQPFGAPGHFWSRPSATSAHPYNGAASSGSNLGPLNPALATAIQTRVTALRTADPGNTAPVPVDLVTSSASGLDPEISPSAALYQLNRVARERGLPAARVEQLLSAHTAGRSFGMLGEARVNVLELNLALDRMFGQPTAP